jgi:hypothetical protein
MKGTEIVKPDDKTAAVNNEAGRSRGSWGRVGKGGAMKRIAVKVSGFALVVFLLSPLVVCAAFIRADRDTPARWYVAAASRGGSDSNSGKSMGKPLATVGAALSKIEGGFAGYPSDVPSVDVPSVDVPSAEIVILGELDQAVRIETRDNKGMAVILRGESFLIPGKLRGTVTVGEGAYVTLGKHLTVTGGGRGVEVIGGHFTLDGAVIEENTSAGAGAGVYVEGGTFTMREGSIRNNRAMEKVGGGVYVEGGIFIMSGGEIVNNTTMRGGELSGRAGGGVYVGGNGVFRKSGGGVIRGNRVPPHYKGDQVFVFKGSGSKMRDGPVGEDIWLDSGSDENWDE